LGLKSRFSFSDSGRKEKINYAEEIKVCNGLHSNKFGHYKSFKLTIKDSDLIL
jgi:hypothetical protein